jgi:hypothetical protein
LQHYTQRKQKSRNQTYGKAFLLKVDQKKPAMNRQILLITLFVTISATFAACDKTEYATAKGGSVDLFMLDSYETVGYTNQIDEKTIVTKSQPLVAYADFLSYNAKAYSFKISDAAKERIKNMQHSVHGIAFAIKVDSELIYSGYFWPSFSSASCDWVVIDPLHLYTGNELYVQIGYPGLMQGQAIQDKRNDKRILDTFESDGKLIK